MGSQSSWPARLLLVVLHMLAAGGGNGGARALPLPGWAPALSAWRGRASQRSRGGSSASACSELFGAAAAQQGPTHTVLIVADPGGFSGVPEAHYFLAHLEGAVAVPSGTTMCHSATRGKLLGQPVLVVTSGIGQRSAASCAASLLTLCSQRFKEVIFFGTAGCSVQRGGVLNAGECSAANPDTQVARIGDLCISPFALDGTCRIASWQQQSAGWPDACSLPQESAGPEAQDILGHCLFSAVPPGSMELTEELLAAARAAQGSYHARSPSLLQYEAQYWARMAAGTGVAYQVPPGAQPSVFDYTSCSETDSNFFYEGVPFEMQAREGVATLIRQALGANFTARDVLAFSTMEAVGLLHALNMYHSEPGRRPIPYTVLRTCSDYMHSPVARQTGGGWEEGGKLEFSMAEGYRHAIATGSRAVLRLLEQRCLKAGGRKTSCTAPLV